MSRSLFGVIALVMLVPALLLAAGLDKSKVPIVNLPYPSMEPVNGLQGVIPGPIVETDGIDEIGDTTMVGDTWYENQANGTIGRMIAVDSQGYRHIVWMRGYDSGQSQRHVWYNVVNPNAMTLQWPTGTVVDQSSRSGFTNLAVDPEGRAIIAMHHQITAGVNETGVYVDILPRTGAFVPNTARPYPFAANPMIWPRMARMTNGNLLIISTESVPSGTTQQSQCWWMGAVDGSTGTVTFTAPDSVQTTTTIAADVAASRVSNRVGAAWTVPMDPVNELNQYNNDIHAMIDNDGVELNFLNWWNVTQFIPPDPSLLPDTLRADRDTLRAYTDVNCFFDENDYMHITFTTPAYWAYEGLISNSSDIIWTWSEQFPNDFKAVGYYWYYPGAVPGAWNRTAQRPSMGQDPTTGKLYCMIQVYDSLGIAASGYPSGEIYVAVSDDNGLNWHEGVNVTNTRTPEQAAPGQSLSELTPTMAELVDGYCHITYTLDRDAGNQIQTPPEGVPTLNPFMYHRVPVEALGTTPLVPQWPAAGAVPFHVGTVAEVQPGHGVMPAKFELAQNSPNPFNPTTNIQFSLASTSTVDLSVYNLSGAKVATVASGTYAAGSHSVTFDASKLSSGVYLYTLQANGQTLTRKMALVK